MSLAPPPRQDCCVSTNIRYIMVMLVVVFHVSAGYSGLPEFFMETDSGGFFLTLRNILASLPLMHTLFFVAGYFALQSLRGKSYGQFLRNKFQRIGVPFLFCVLFLGPAMPYLGYYSQSFNGLSSASYGDFWLTYLKSGFSEWITPIVFTPNPQFHHQHFWFLSVLLQFFVLFALAHAAWKRWGRSSDNSPGDTPSITKALLIAALLIAAVKTIGYSLGFTHGLFAILFHNPIYNTFTYGGFFALGIYAQARGWFVDGRVPGLRTFGVLTGALVLLGLVGFGIYKLWGELLPQLFFRSLGSLFDTLFVIWFLAIVTGLAYRYMNRPSTINSRLAANSYLIYLIHYPLILIFRLPLLTWEVPAFFKFPIVLLLAALVSYALSEYLIRPFARLSVAALIGLHVLLCVIGLPRSSYSHLLLERRDELHAVIPADVRPEQVAEPLPDTLDARSRATPVTRISRQNGAFYFAYQPGGLHALLPDGSKILLNSELELGDLAPLPGDHLAAVDPQAGRIVELDAQGQVVATLVDSSDSTGVPEYLATDTRGGIYFTTEAKEEETGKIFYRSPDDLILVMVEEDLQHPGALALSADGATLFLSDPENGRIWTFAVDANGGLANRHPFAELFLGDGRYGRPREKPVDSQAEGLTTDTAGRLYVATRFGVQLFSQSGELLGVINFPDVPLSTRPKRPLSCVFGGEDLSTLYVSCGDEVYTVRTRAKGFQQSSPLAANFPLDTVKARF